MNKWKKISWDNEQQIEFKTGRKFKVKKQLDFNEKHNGSWQVWECVNNQWEWIDNYSPMWFAKENVLKLNDNT
jgi:hypothetical protein